MGPGHHRLEGDDELRDDGQDLAAAVLEHVEGALDREEAVRLLLLAQAVAEDGEVVVVVELLNVHLPLNLIADARVLDRDGKVSALVEPTEFCIGWVWPRNKGPALWNLEGFRSYNGFGK